MRTAIGLFFLLLACEAAAQSVTTAEDWSRHAISHTKRTEGAGVIYEGRLYALAGFARDAMVTLLSEVFDPATNRWTELEPIPRAVSHVGFALVDGQVWIVGGFEGDHPGPAVDIVQIYDITSDKWLVGPPLPVRRASGILGLIGRKLHYVGGLLEDRRTDTGEHYVLDVDDWEGGWTTAAPLPSPRNHLSGVVMDGSLYAIGGQYNHDDPITLTDLVHVYDPVSDAWTELQPMPIRRSHAEAGAFVFDGQIYVAGGRVPPETPPTATDVIHRYDPVENRWSAVATLPHELQGSEFGVIGDRIYVANGSIGNSSNAQDSTWSTAFPFPPPPDPLPVDSLVIEAGSLTVAQDNGNQWHEVSLTNSYENPVVVMSPVSFNGNQPATARVRNVGSSSFEFQIDEWDYLDGAHGSETLHYIVVEAGNYLLDGGQEIEAGTVTRNSKGGTVNFARVFENTPAVVSQIVTVNDGSAAVTRESDVTAGGFYVRLQGEQASRAHGFEEIAYLAVSQGNGQIGALALEAGVTSRAVDHTFYSLQFAQSLPQPPAFLAAMQSYFGGDPATLRYQNLSGSGVQVKVEEEQSSDTEMNHTKEIVGYLTMEQGAFGGGDGGGTPPANRQPTASFSAVPEFGPAPLTVSFDPSASFDPDGTIQSYAWDFDGDGVADETVPASTSVDFTYTAAGAYTARLTVLDDDGASASATVLVSVTDPSTGDGAFVEAEGQVVMEAEHFDEQVSREGKSWVAKQLSGNVGGSMRPEPVTNTNNDSNYSSRSPELQYRIQFNAAGTYYVWARVYAANGDSDSWHVGLDGQALTSADRMSAGGPYGQWRWINSTMDKAPATLQIAAPGTHVVNVWMREDGVYFDRLLLTTSSSFVPSGNGPAESARAEDDPTDPPPPPPPPPPNEPPVAAFTATPDSGAAPLTVAFDASSSNDSDGTIVSYAWDFDGDAAADTTGEDATGYAFTFATPGTYSALLVVTDDDGAVDSASVIVEVVEPDSGGGEDPPPANEPPSASFTATPDSGAAPLAVSFDASGSSDPDGSIVSYAWDFDGDAAPDTTGENPTGYTFTYAEPGQHGVILIVVDDDGAVDSSTVIIEVVEPDSGGGDDPPPLNEPPMASFTATPDSGAAPLTVSFDASGSSDSDGSIVSYAWDFDGDGVVDTTAENATGFTFTYSIPGSYTAQLIVADDAGATDSISTSILAVEPLPVVDAFIETDGQVVMETESFDASISRRGKSWIERDLPGNLSASMRAEPVKKNGSNIESGYSSASPEMQYRVLFSTVGTYYVWVRAQAAGASSDGWHVGLDGAETASADRMTVGSTFGVWTWTNGTADLERANLQVAATGAHDVNVWMQREGVYLDRILLTTDPAFTPTGTGPAESARTGSVNAVAAPDGGGLRLLTDSEPAAAAPDQFALRGNFPNPFNPSTTIHYALPEDVHVRLEVYDVLGRRIALLVDELQQAGIHQVSFSGHRFAGGVYFYRIQAGTFGSVSQMTLLK